MSAPPELPEVVSRAFDVSRKAGYVSFCRNETGRLLATLAESPGTVLGREALMTQVWGWSDAQGTRTLDSHVKSLRAKLGAGWVRTAHGVGYAFEEVQV